MFCTHSHLLSNKFGIILIHLLSNKFGIKMESVKKGNLRVEAQCRFGICQKKAPLKIKMCVCVCVKPGAVSDNDMVSAGNYESMKNDHSGLDKDIGVILGQ
ncbi:hypothetical protein ACH5RR_034212 [Cinchona calisaya]|uniref:Uncharacterized protein n=1 Tax=Cinchona calisaya TaxID=153742 RepID=A0ABD2YCE3_9GENT